MSSKQLIKGSLIPIVLKLLDDRGAMYGYEITQHVKELTSGELNITEGALYPTLHKLENQGLLSTYLEVVDNRARKYYQLTKEGQKVKTRKIAEFQEVFLKLQHLLFPQLKWTNNE